MNTIKLYIYIFILFEISSLIYSYELLKIYNFLVLLPFYIYNILPITHPIIDYIYLIYITSISFYSMSFKIIILEFIYLLTSIIYTIYPIINDLNDSIYDIVKNYIINEYITIINYSILNDENIVILNNE